MSNLYYERLQDESDNEFIDAKKVIKFAEDQIQKYVRDPKHDNMWACGYKAGMVDIIEFTERARRHEL